MHFTYESSVGVDLSQGDILRRTPEVDTLFKEVHPRYFYNDDNKYFIVLTQSCDLVRRHKGSCKSPYITLAAVRPLSALLKRKLEFTEINGVPVCSAKVRYEQFLERLINNNEPEYFYLHQEPTADFPEPCCAFLALSIPVKADLHYQKCVDARILSLQETFKAKLGWLVGQMYSRVGTQDWERSALKEKVSELIDQAALWLDTKQIKELQRAVNEWRAANPTTEITPKLVLELSEQLPTRKQKALSRIEAIVKGGGKGVPELTPEQIKSLLRHLSNDQGLTEVLR